MLLFLIPIDCDDINKEYEVLLNELRQFNPQMLDKHRVVAITKCDTVDLETVELIKPHVNLDVPVVYISSVAQMGIDELKDVLWEELNSESNKLEAVQTEHLVHRHREVSHLAGLEEAEDSVDLSEEENEEGDDEF